VRSSLITLSSGSNTSHAAWRPNQIAPVRSTTRTLPLPQCFTARSMLRGNSVWRWAAARRGHSFEVLQVVRGAHAASRARRVRSAVLLLAQRALHSRHMCCPRESGMVWCRTVRLDTDSAARPRRSINTTERQQRQVGLWGHQPRARRCARMSPAYREGRRAPALCTPQEAPTPYPAVAHKVHRGS
jgi:hypothetical protein